MDLKKLIQTMDSIESKKTLNESQLNECPPMEGDMGAAPMNPGNPVTVSITMNASGKDHVADLLNMIKNAGLGDAEPAMAPTPPMRQDIDRLRAVVGEPEMEADAAYSNVITDDEGLEEAVDPKSLMGQIRKMAKGVETNPDEKQHRIFASQVESDLIDLFQYYDQVERNSEKKETVRNLIRQNKKAQRETDLRNANNIVSVLWDLMNANEAYDNEPEEEYQDHEYMTKDLSGGLNREKGAYAAAQPGDNAMAVEDDDDTSYSIRGKTPQAQSELAKRARTAGNEAMAETIKKNLMAALSEKKKPDADGDGVPDWADKKPGKDDNEGKKKGSKPKKGQVPPQFKKKTNESDDDSQAKAAAIRSRRDIEIKGQKDRHGINRKPGESLAAFIARSHKLKKKNAAKTNEAELDEISSDLAKRYTKNAKMDRDFNDDDITRLAKSGQSTQDMHRRNAKRTKGINQAKKRIEK
jgi:hypothetical protein